MAVPSPKSFTLLCWNIDGLDKKHKDVIERAHYVCDFVQSNCPHAVFLQEVVPETEKEFISRLGDSYHYFCATKPPLYGYRYFVAILVRKMEDITVTKGVEEFVFTQSVMERHVIKVSVTFCGAQIELLTSHLESLPEYSDERKIQLSHVFRWITESRKKNPQKSYIFGGDTNLISDEEFQAVGLPPNTVDVWEACGSQEDTKYTWDVGVNDNHKWTGPPGLKSRIDRLYLASCDQKVTAKSFKLLGKDRLPSKRFPSDHWGIWSEFCVQTGTE